MSHPAVSSEESLSATMQAQLQHTRHHPFLFQLLLKQWQRVSKRLVYFYQHLASLPRRNRRALQRALATSLVGAAMLLALSSAPMVQAAGMTVDGTGKADDGKCSLVEAIYNSNSDSQLYVTAGECPAGSGADVITLPNGGTFDYLNHFAPLAALPVITSDITINANNSTISRNSGAVDDFGVLGVSNTPGSSLTLNDATVTGGTNATSSYLDYGGGIFNNGGTLIVHNCTITGNSSFAGGGISTFYGTTKVYNSTISGNYALGGGGVAVINGDMTLDNNTIVSGNDAYVGGGLLNASVGSPFNAVESHLTVSNSLVAYNYTFVGGGVNVIGYYDTTPKPPPAPEGTVSHPKTARKALGKLLQKQAAGVTLQDLKTKHASGAAKPGTLRKNGHPSSAAAQDDDTRKRGSKPHTQPAPKPERANASTYAITNIDSSTISHNYARYYGGGIATGYAGPNSSKYTKTYVTNSIITTNYAGEGGGVHNYLGTVEITDSTITNNHAIYEDGGGVRNNGGTVTITGTTVSGNTAVDDGGGLNNRGYGTMDVTNSTLTGNRADSDSNSTGDGGGFRNVTGGIATLANVTIVNNSAAYGGGVANEENTTLERTLISGNTASVLGNQVANWYNLTVDDFNLFGHSGETNAQALYGFAPGATDITATSDGTTPTALASILNTTLANNNSLVSTPGGIVQTLALTLGGPAIDRAPNAECTPLPTNDIDQRSLPRNVNINNGNPNFLCDIGAYEVQDTNVTAIDIANWRAGINRKGRALLRWQTLTESQIAGFNVWRQNGKGEWKQVNANFRQAKHSGGTLGDKYRFTDKTAKAGKTYRYKLQVKYLDGHTEWTGIVKVKLP